MPHSQFVSFRDDGFDVPPEKTVTEHPPGIPKMVDLDEDRDAFLAFKYQILSGTGRLSVKLNDVQFKAITFESSDSAAPRVWYETIGGGILHKRQNKIVVDVHDDDDGSAKVHVSDFKIFYHTP
jgi:hypothetical protein